MAPRSASTPSPAAGALALARVEAGAEELDQQPGDLRVPGARAPGKPAGTAPIWKA
jgi:hypothetical protein